MPLSSSIGVPVMLQWATPRAELEALAKRLDALLPSDALVVASVDFSHYQPAPWATFHDESSFSTGSEFVADGGETAGMAPGAFD